MRRYELKSKGRKKIAMKDRKVQCMLMLDDASIQKLEKIKPKFVLTSRSAVVRKLIRDYDIG